jgi:uncharacterized protein YbaR (Trm112 family)
MYSNANKFKKCFSSDYKLLDVVACPVARCKNGLLGESEPQVLELHTTRLYIG